MLSQVSRTQVGHNVAPPLRLRHSIQSILQQYRVRRMIPNEDCKWILWYMKLGIVSALCSICPVSSLHSSFLILHRSPCIHLAPSKEFTMVKGRKNPDKMTCIYIEYLIYHSPVSAFIQTARSFRPLSSTRLVYYPINLTNPSPSFSYTLSIRHHVFPTCSSQSTSSASSSS